MTDAMRPPNVAARTSSGTSVKSMSNRSMRYGRAMSTVTMSSVNTPLTRMPRSSAIGLMSRMRARAPKRSAASTSVRVRLRYALIATRTKIPRNRTLFAPCTSCRAVTPA